MRTDTRVETYAVDNGFRVQPFHLRVRVEFIEIAYAQRQIGVGEELDGFRLRRTHDTHLDILLDRALFEQRRKTFCCGNQCRIAEARTDDDTTRVEVVI